MAVEILKCCDGARDVAAIARELATRFEADRAIVEQDVTAIVQDLADKGVMAA
jgi:pyrroloquinoline quinone biosynthesis protein D